MQNKPKCPNCKAALSCGCQKRTASDNKQCCTACISQYENRLKLAENVSDPSLVNGIYIKNND